MSIINLLASDSFVIFNKAIAKQYGINEALILGELCSEHAYWEKEGKLQNGWFFSTIDNVEQNTALSGSQQRAALNHLQQEGFLRTSVKGLPATRWVYLNINALSQRFLNTSTEGYIKDIPEPPKDEETVKEKEQVKDKKSKPKKSVDSEGMTGDSVKSFKAVASFINTLNYPDTMKDALYKWYSTVAPGKCTIGQLKDKLLSLDTSCGGNLKRMEDAVIKSYQSNWFGFFPVEDKSAKASSNLVFSNNINKTEQAKEEIVVSDDPKDVW